MPIRDIGNKFFSTSAISTTYSNITSLASIDMNINNFNVGINDNYEKARRCTMSSKMNTSRTISMSSSEASVDYITRMEQLNNSLDKEIVRNLINSSQLSYANEGETNNPVSEVADSRAIKEQCGGNENLALNRAISASKHVYNVQIPYNIN